TETVNKYEDAEFDNPEVLLQQTVDQLEERAGMLPVVGPGLTLTVGSSPELIGLGYEIKPVSPELLIRLINDLNRYNVRAIEVDDIRLSYNATIRDINGKTTIYSEAIQNTYIEINIITI